MKILFLIIFCAALVGGCSQQAPEPIKRERKPVTPVTLTEPEVREIPEKVVETPEPVTPPAPAPVVEKVINPMEWIQQNWQGHISEVTITQELSVPIYDGEQEVGKAKVPANVTAPVEAISSEQVTIDFLNHFHPIPISATDLETRAIEALAAAQAAPEPEPTPTSVAETTSPVPEPPAPIEQTKAPEPVGDFDVKSGFTVIDSLRELRKAIKEDNQKIRMKPGHYKIKGFEEDGETVMEFTGSNNTFDLTGVTIEFETELFLEMARVKTHGLRMYTIYGDNITIIGGRFEDTGDTPPNVSVANFFIEGDDFTFEDCTVIVRGSSPYGVGDMLGKGRENSARLQKHSGMALSGDRPYIKNCHFRITTFGHGIHIHGSQDSHLDGVTMLGDQRNTSDIIDSKDPWMKPFDYKFQYPSWKKGQPIPRDQWIGLTEDGIRAYLDGSAHRGGERRRTGHITVENCHIDSMRGGITLAIGSSATVTDSTAINCSHGYSLPSGSTIKNCKGNATRGPLLTMPYSHKGNSVVELELLDSDDVSGDHPLAEITGNNHEITITTSSRSEPAKLRPILIGSTGARYTEKSAEAEELKAKNSAKGIILNNKTNHPVKLGAASSDCRVKTKGKVLEDEGKNNDH